MHAGKTASLLAAQDVWSKLTMRRYPQTRVQVTSLRYRERTGIDQNATRAPRKRPVATATKAASLTANRLDSIAGQTPLYPRDNIAA